MYDHLRYIPAFLCFYREYTLKAQNIQKNRVPRIRGPVRSHLGPPLK